jgi:hypothetical protein
MKYYWNTTNNIPSNNNSITSKEEKTLSKKTKNTNSAPILKEKSTQKKSVKSNSDLKVSPKNSPPETPKQSNELEQKLAIVEIIKPKKSSNTSNVRQVLPEEPKAVLPILSIQPKELPKQQEVLQPETSTVEVSKPQVVPVAPPPVVLQKKREPPVDLTSFFGHIRFESLMRKPKKRSNSPEPIHLQEHEKVLFRKILSDYEEEIIIRNRIFVEKQQQQQQRSLHTSQTVSSF